MKNRLILKRRSKANLDGRLPSLKKRYLGNINPSKPVGFFVYLDKRTVFAITGFPTGIDDKMFPKAWIH